MNRRNLNTPQRIVLACCGLLLFIVVQYFGDARKNTRRARELVTGFCGENEACVDKAEEHLGSCVAVASTRTSKHSVSFDVTTFSECIRPHLGLDKPRG